MRKNPITSKGCALEEPLILLNAHKIKQNLKNKIDLFLFESIDSTNDFFKHYQQSNTIKICLAEQQTQGRGRLNRSWYSPFGQNIYFSCAYFFRKAVSELSGLSLVVSLAIVKTLTEMGVKNNLYAKWPNDVMYQNKKLAGNLIEIQAENFGVTQVIIGIGVNINTLEANHSVINQAWTSLRKILNQYIDRNIFCALLINNLLDYLQQFEQGGFTLFMPEWTRIDYLLNQVIVLKNVEKRIKGMVVGINQQGHLLLALADASIHAFSSGDTFILKEG